MRRLALVAGAPVLFALVAYAAGLGVYAVASAPGPASTQPRSPAEAQAALVRLGLASAYPFAHRFELVPHGRMHYVEQGAGPVVVCLHGNGSWSLECADLLRERSAAARVIAPDLIGFGLSEKPSPAADPIAAHAADLAALLGALDVRDAQLVATPTSSEIALALVALAPERVRRDSIEAKAAPSARLAALAPAPVLGPILVQGLGALSPGWARGPHGRVQATWDERASSLALARAR